MFLFFLREGLLRFLLSPFTVWFLSVDLQQLISVKGECLPFTIFHNISRCLIEDQLPDGEGLWKVVKGSRFTFTGDNIYCSSIYFLLVKGEREIVHPSSETSLHRTLFNNNKELIGSNEPKLFIIRFSTIPQDWHWLPSSSGAWQQLRWWQLPTPMPPRISTLE